MTLKDKICDICLWFRHTALLWLYDLYKSLSSLDACNQMRLKVNTYWSSHYRTYYWTLVWREALPSWTHKDHWCDWPSVVTHNHPVLQASVLEFPRFGEVKSLTQRHGTLWINGTNLEPSVLNTDVLGSYVRQFSHLFNITLSWNGLINFHKFNSGPNAG